VSNTLPHRKEVTYTFDSARGRSAGEGSTTRSQAAATIPRIARLMALAIRLDGLLQQEVIKDYADLARLGSVTRGRMTQIMQLLHLAPDIQEQLLFLAEIPGLNERNLRAIVSCIDWGEQRSMFEKITRNRAERV
jgi:hypothetical protein